MSKHERYSPRHTARSLALEVLLECGTRRAFVQEVLDRWLSSRDGKQLSPADRGLATHISYGVLRRRDTLLSLLAPLINRPLTNVDVPIVEILCVGAYQLALLTQIPPHAALNESVELCPMFGYPQAKGFVNGVLRSLSSLLTPDAASGPAPDALPVDNGGYRRLARPILPDPVAQPVEYLSQGFSLPPWLAQRWWDRYDAGECHRLGFWFAGPTPMTLRVNPLRTSREEMLKAMGQGEACEHPQGIRLSNAAVRDLPGFAQGWFTVQDESAMRVGSAVKPQPGWQVLDLCSAPGGKTTHLAEMMQNQGRVVACDIDEERLASVRELSARLGLTCVETVRIDPDRANSVPVGPFDAVLVDAPCSNTGVMGKRPELRWRIGPGDLRELVALQKRLLTLAISRTRPGGVVVYSTCSIEPEENAAVVRASGVMLEAEEESVPGRPADGGYWARLRV